jgi:uncharacterized repeat protein (TIGR01451 family)
LDKKMVWWNLTDELSDGDITTVIFYAKVVGYGDCINVVNITANECSGEIWYCEDTAQVNTVAGLIFEKEVWDPELQAWVDEIDASVGDTIRYRISIIYYGGWTLYNIKIVDELPECLEYADDAIPEEPEIAGNTLFWNLSIELSDTESVTIEFDALIVTSCEPCINLAEITADECSGQVLTDSDSATVNIECAFIADAGGPYSGNIGETISLEGSATGGTPPYKSFKWDLDDDGVYDDASGETVSYSWDTPGTHVISLVVTDDEDETAVDDTTVTIGNDPPNKPNTPTGTTSGRIGISYQYSASTTDPEGNDIYYMFDWDDGTNSGWLGPFNSGDTANTFHTWTTQGSYSVKVKAKDEFDAETDWSDPLSVSMPKNKQVTPLLIEILEKLMNRFPLLSRILTLLPIFYNLPI